MIYFNSNRNISNDILDLFGLWDHFRDKTNDILDTIDKFILVDISEKFLKIANIKKSQV